MNRKEIQSLCVYCYEIVMFTSVHSLIINNDTVTENLYARGDHVCIEMTYKENKGLKKTRGPSATLLTWATIGMTKTTITNLNLHKLRLLSRKIDTALLGKWFLRKRLLMSFLYIFSLYKLVPRKS